MPFMRVDTCRMLVRYLSCVALTVCSVASFQTPKPLQRPKVVCYIRIYPKISDAVLRQVANCTHVIVTNGGCDLSKTVRRLTDQRRIAQLRNALDCDAELNSTAKILREISIDFGSNRTFPTMIDEEKLLQLVDSSLQNDLFDGVHLDYDAAQFDSGSPMTKYQQLLKTLRRRYGRDFMMSTSVICRRPLSSQLTAILNEEFNFVILQPSVDEMLKYYREGLFIPRVYNGYAANCLMDTNFPPHKIVLGLPTGGSPIDLSERSSNNTGYISYEQVCDFQLFPQEMDQGLVLVYDDVNSAHERALQTMLCYYYGISIQLDYDDQQGTCIGKDFPILGAILDVFEKRSGVSSFQRCPFEFHSLPAQNCTNQTNTDVGFICCNDVTVAKQLEEVINHAEGLTELMQNVADKFLSVQDRLVGMFTALEHAGYACCENHEDLETI